MRHILQDRRGETMIEVLIALIILVVGGFAAVRLISLTAINTQVAEERIVATNLAREGIEAVRSIRDTNWLRYAGERRHCWNNYDDPRLPVADCVDADNDGAPDTAIGHEQSYLIEVDTSNHKWEMTPIVDRLDLQSDPADATQYQLRIDPGSQLYRHGGTEGAPYFREIYTEYLDDTGRTLATATPPESANVLRVSATVEWFGGGRVQAVTLTTILTDYLGRSDHL